MAWTARDEEDTKEFFDSLQELDRKVSLLAEMVASSKHMIAFTGAGISTAAGIPDFRSGMDTKLETGPGAWELRAKGVARSSKHKEVCVTKAIPTPTHMMLVKLHQESILKCVISQNCDGLHRRSGLPKNGLYELHGNSNVEKCTKCKREYLRDFGIRSGLNHLTGRKCDDPNCAGVLKDTIINFGENLPTDTLQTSFDHSEKADLCLAMGSSLTVTPAANIPETVGMHRRNLVIVNLQRTPLDRLAKLRINAKCDDVTRLLMSKLKLAIPEFRLKRKILLSSSVTEQGKVRVVVQGMDVEGHPFSFLKQVKFSHGEKLCDKAPYECECESGRVTVTVTFHAHYGEPPLELPLTAPKDKDVEVVVSLSYNPFVGAWQVQRSDDREEKSPSPPLTPASVMEMSPRPPSPPLETPPSPLEATKH